MRLLSTLSERVPDPVFYRVLAWTFPVQEPELLHVRKLIPQDRIAVDVGAWWGPWTYWLARTVPEVLAIEPQARLASYLRNVVPDNVRVEATALADRPGSGTLGVPGGGRGADALASLVDSGDAGVEVPVTTLDLLCSDEVGFVKIDVEGAELAVLRGATETIERWRPSLMIEIEEQRLDTPIAVAFDELAELGYDGFYWHRGWHRVRDFDVQARQHAHAHHPKKRDFVNNFFFVHADGLTRMPATER